MLRAESTVNDQHLGHGYFAKVILDVEFNETSEELRILFNESYAVMFREAAAFGIAYGWEQYGKKMGRGLVVNVVEIGWQPVDTSSALVALVAARAILNALSWHPVNSPTFDEATGVVTFHKTIRR